MANSVPFCQMVRASGLAEPWTHVNEDSKFDQFGWRCTTKENGYGVDTLVGNYTEEHFDLKERLKSKPLPSQYNHYFTTTYDKDFNKGHPTLPAGVRELKRNHPRSFPGHQPELDTAVARSVYNDWNTTSTAAYKPYHSGKLSMAQQIEKQANNDPEIASQWQVTMETTPITHLGARAGPPANGGFVIAAPHAAPGTGAGAHQRSFKVYQ